MKATWLASVCTPAMRCAATKSAAMARARGAYVVYGGIHATLYPEESLELGGAHAVVKGDGDVVWAKVLADCVSGAPKTIYEGGRIDADQFSAARWDLIPRKLHVGLGANRSRLPQALFLLFGVAHRWTEAASAYVPMVVEEIVQLRRLGFRFIALADDNFYPVTLTDLATGREQKNTPV